ncbi:MAG: thioredoxin family protein, partial [Proteobacteria bacterium]|nr:thioredoxin family protein [Pseudomonadota bacterium]
VHAAKEFDKRCKSYNQWIDSMTIAYDHLYVGHLFNFQKLQHIDWSKTAEEQFYDQTSGWFDNFDFDDSLVLRSRQLNEFLNSYVGLFGQKAKTTELRDSLFTLAGSLACEKASKGDPRIYGWMVDYFFNGYESYNITEGLQMLEKHIQNPHCLTSKKLEITRRLEGIKHLTPGVPAPMLRARDFEGNEVELNMQLEEKDYRLVVFYASDCGHCEELFANLNKWYDIPENRVWFDIVSVGLDDLDETWQQEYNKRLFPWTDLYAPEGVNSEAASNYYVLSTPSLFVIDKYGDLAAIPGSVKELDRFLNGE